MTLMACSAMGSTGCPGCPGKTQCHSKETQKKGRGGGGRLWSHKGMHSPSPGLSSLISSSSLPIPPATLSSLSSLTMPSMSCFSAFLPQLPLSEHLLLQTSTGHGPHPTWLWSLPITHWKRAPPSHAVPLLFKLCLHSV